MNLKDMRVQLEILRRSVEKVRTKPQLIAWCSEHPHESAAFITLLLELDMRIFDMLEGKEHTQNENNDLAE